MLGERIATLRKEYNLSQYDLAERLGFSRGKLANYEQGSRQPDYDTLIKIARFFDVTIDYLLGESFERKSSSDNLASSEFDNLSKDEKDYLKMQLEIYRSIKK
ncbi:helix-turn-helix domain-containing protein [Cytobacillus oceanisediminis]|uniref:helix-turn-helix domain-containing protein n=1 Tax=Cytobacillus oceanisediminis TaxID=665099 RepID=UPI00338EA225